MCVRIYHLVHLANLWVYSSKPSGDVLVCNDSTPLMLFPSSSRRVGFWFTYFTAINILGIASLIKEMVERRVSLQYQFKA